jgi:hypothetical protein
MAERNRNVLTKANSVAPLRKSMQNHGPLHRGRSLVGALALRLGERVLSSRNACIPTLLCACAALVPRGALADENKMLILPTTVRSKQCETEQRLSTRPDPAMLLLARRVDTLLSDSVQDLDLSLEIAPPTRPDDDRKPSISEEALVKMADSRWVVAPTLVVDGSKLELRLVTVAPGSRVLATRAQEIDLANVDVRAVVMLGELVRAQSRTSAALHSSNPNEEPQGQTPTPVRSEGRGVLAISSALFGGFTGYWLQRAGGSDDARVTYPITALGAGIGLGASMLFADEWDITLDDAWILTAGMGWPAASGYFLAKGYDTRPSWCQTGEDCASGRYIYALAGAGIGLSLASASISLHKSTPGGAVMVHSGGAFGTFLGALTEWTRYGNTDFTPSKGMGAGAGIGVLAAGVLATQLDTSSTRVLFIDLAASLGALSGAALASPLLFVEKGTTLPVNRNRAWLVAVGTGTLVGGGIGWLATRHMSAPTQQKRSTVSYMPYFNFTSDPTAPNPNASRGWVAGLTGTW